MCIKKIEGYVKKYPVKFALIIFGCSVFVELISDKIFSRGLAIASFGAIFVALKYKLDQALYHRALFDERYKVFMVVRDVLIEWFPNNKATREMVDKLNDKFLTAYYIFGDSTFQFIENVRRAINILAYQLPNIEDTEEVKRAKSFLNSLNDSKEFPKFFPELKIDGY